MIVRDHRFYQRNGKKTDVVNAGESHVIWIRREKTKEQEIELRWS